MNVDEARAVCKDRTRWRSVVSAYLHWKGVSLCMYVLKKKHIDFQFTA